MEQTTCEVSIDELLRGGWANDEGNRVSFSLDFATTRKLHELAFNFGITVDMALMACYAILLAKYTGEDDPVIGYMLESQMFPIRYSPTVHKPLGEFLIEVKHTTMQALEDRNMRKNLSGNPFIKAAFTWQNANTTPLKSDHLGTFELALTAFKKESIMIRLEYSTRSYRKETIEQMGGHLSRIVHEVADFPEKVIADIRMMSEEEERQIQAFSGTKTDYPSGQTVHYLFEEQVRLTPDRPAVMTEDHQMSYRELNEHANQLAQALQDHGVKPESVVGIVADRSVSMIVGLTAILKAGGAYMPIEADSPCERIEYMLEDSRAGFLLAPSSWKPDFAFEGKVIYWDNAQLYLDSCPHTISAVTSQSLAYIIYTSGSTGTPKGVMVEHRNIARLVKNTNYFNFSKEHRILQTGTIAFDASTFEIWGSLLNGSTLYLMKDTDLFDLHKLKETIIGHRITAWFLTTALFHNLAEQDPDAFCTLDTLLVGGEALSPKHVNAVSKRCPGLRMVNTYGPTENTTFSTFFPIERDCESAIPIGRPICNSSAYILDKQLKLQPIGVVGELCVGGDGIARGYVNRLELTEAKFVEHPLLGERLYRTGDLALWLPDGNIEMIGRIDDQVKIRGYRVEPGEIETRLLEHNGISKAAVAVKADGSGNPIICAYFVAKQVLSETEVKAYLARNLPEYFLPSLVVQMESLPLTPNGKVDKKALPDPDLLRPMLVN
ncbi:non-ribosomal peptide synthetase [Paenibacillus lautus]|uniref:non-ribosomal peptide synthetase n=1 Tax=Paenibacillus lautus TaxID=1401 RepID=UPI0013E3500A|nr:amino acid adenylation domain-containing protein [Paenibacillus lautus]